VNRLTAAALMAMPLVVALLVNGILVPQLPVSGLPKVVILGITAIVCGVAFVLITVWATRRLQ
jgi:hypothetical protein